MGHDGDIERAPISDEAFCGPDLDLDGDTEFMNFVAAIEGQLPGSFFSFDRKSIDFPAAFTTAARLKTRTHDLRLNLIVAKLSILNRDFYGFADEVAQVRWFLETHWEDVHPRAETGKFATRLAQLGTLDDGPVIVLPLQYATLLQTERDGSLNFRAVMVTMGEVKLREGEKLASSSAIERMLGASVDIEALAKLHAALSRLGDDLAAITLLTTERINHESAVKFGALAPLVAKMRDFAQDALARRDPTAAPSPTAQAGDAGGASAPARFDTLVDVDVALAAALGYFQTREPSSPALLLIVQARATLGKNLYEVIRLIAPQHADNARVFVGPSDAFSIPVKNLADAPALDFSPADAPPVETRAQALSLIEQVATHLRAAEPSSPAPYLLDRARSLAPRDFLSLLGEVFPADDLESMKGGH
jgi:type VI secretion system protein ImpA